MWWMYQLFLSLLVIGLVVVSGCANITSQIETAAESTENVSGDYDGHISNRPEETKTKKEQQDKVNQHYRKIQILGINDLHGQLNVTRKVNGQLAGRVDYLAAFLKQRTSENKNTLLIHVGDMVGASPPISSLWQDEPTIKVLNEIGFDIGTVGNHEFDRGIDDLWRLLEGDSSKKRGSFSGANFPVIVANVVEEKSENPIFSPYKILKMDGMPIGFIGVVSTETPSSVSQSGIKGLNFTDEVAAINRSVSELKKKGVRSIIVLAHNPGSSSLYGENPSGQLVEMANKVDDEVDIIYGAHNHAYMNATVDSKLLVQSYSFGTAFSDVEIEIDPATRDIISKKAEVVTTFQNEVEPDSEITNFLAYHEAEVEPIVNAVIGSTSFKLTAFRNENGESIMGDLVADAHRLAMDTDFAFMNPGGIRADIDKGDITWGGIYKVQPFQNHLIKMTMTGHQIRKVLNQQWQKGPTMLQISGFIYTWDESKPDGQKVLNIQLPDGSKIVPDQTYSVTANSFLAEGGDGFSVFSEAENKEVGLVDLNAVVDFIRKQPKPFSYKLANRIRKLNEQVIKNVKQSG